MKVIKFPEGGVRSKAESPQNLGKLYLGAFSYTCPCGNKSSFEPQNLIFRSVDFYCPKCGAAHRITNPAFSPAPSSPSKTSKR